jgi:glucokinase
VAAIISDWTATYGPRIVGVGVGVPGLVDAQNGFVIRAGNLGWEAVHLKDELSSRLPDRQGIWVQNDTNAQALGEHLFGAGRGFKDFVYLGIGTGLGSGLVINGQLVAGDTGAASEIGHLSLDPSGRACVCGLRGCIETVASGRGLLDETKEMLEKQVYPTSLAVDHGLTAKDVVQAAYHADPLAVAVMTRFADVLALVVAIYVATLNPARIILGGGLGRASFDFVQPIIKKELARRVPASRYQHLEIVRSEVASSAIGAASLVWQQRLNS